MEAYIILDYYYEDLNNYNLFVRGITDFSFKRF